MALLESSPNDTALDLSVLLPVRNSAALLPDHLRTLENWSHLAREIVVVDSQSSDGTIELLQAGLRHPCLRILQHPPGLYQSWNFGIQNLAAKYTYISTVGDSITADGLRHLAKVAEEWNCDVVISKPDFIDAQGRTCPPDRWPIDDVVGSLGISEPRVVENELLFLFILLNCTEAILGSSASNLYRTEFLQRHPFPIDYGTVGDGAWGDLHALEMRLGVTPKKFSIFRHHPKSYSSSEYSVAQLPEKLFALCRQTYERSHLPSSGRVDWETVVEAVEQRLSWQRQLVQYRDKWVPWILNPMAWRARFRRGQVLARMQQLKTAAIQQLSEPMANPTVQQ
jgi:hypothetical protein